MEGNKTRLNYFYSFKWQPTTPSWLGGNIFTPFSSGKTFLNIPSSVLRYPTGIFGPNGMWRGFLFGQKIYNPGAAGLPAWIFDASKYATMGGGQAYRLLNQDCDCK